MKKILFLVLLILGQTLPLAGEALGDDVFTVVVKKQEEKVKNRWSLQDWLETRDKMRLMDLWLALHTPTPFEYWVGGNYRFVLKGNTGGWEGPEIHGAAYASLFGLEGRREGFSGTSAYHGILNLRVFGFHYQSTNITLQLGLKGTQSALDEYRQVLAGLHSTFYLGRYFGIQGLYRRYFASTPGSLSGRSVAGSRIEGTGFVDYKVLRIYGTYYTESSTAATGQTLTAHSGALAGFKLFF